MSHGRLSTCLWLKSLIAVSALLAMELPAQAMEKQVIQDRVQLIFNKNGSAWPVGIKQRLIDGLAEQMADIPSPQADAVLDSVCKNLVEFLSHKQHPLSWDYMCCDLVEKVRSYRAGYKDDITPEQQEAFIKQIGEHLKQWQKEMDAQAPDYADVHEKAIARVLGNCRQSAAEPLEPSLKRALTDSELAKAMDQIWLAHKQEMLKAAAPSAKDLKYRSFQFNLEATVQLNLFTIFNRTNRPRLPWTADHQKVGEEMSKRMMEVSDWESKETADAWQLDTRKQDLIMRIRPQVEIQFSRLYQQIRELTQQLLGDTK